MRYPPSRRRRYRGLPVFPRSRTVWRQQIISSPMGDTAYYLCPKCGIFLEREFVRYCDQCGQKLNWRVVAQRFADSEDHL